MQKKNQRTVLYNVHEEIVRLQCMKQNRIQITGKEKIGCILENMMYEIFFPTVQLIYVSVPAGLATL